MMKLIIKSSNRVEKRPFETWWYAVKQAKKDSTSSSGVEPIIPTLRALELVVFLQPNFEKLRGRGKVVKLAKKSPQKNRGFKKKSKKCLKFHQIFRKFPYQNRSQSPHIAQSPCFEAVKNHPHPEQAPEGNTRLCEAHGTAVGWNPVSTHQLREW